MDLYTNKVNHTHTRLCRAIIALIIQISQKYDGITKASKGSLPPHIFALAGAAYQGMLRELKAQVGHRLLVIDVGGAIISGLSERTGDLFYKYCGIHVAIALVLYIA